MNRRSSRSLLLVCGLVFSIGGCATVTRPALGPAVEKQSQEIARQLEASGALVDDPELTAYVDAIGQRVAAEASWSPVERFSFAVLDAPEPNAFSIPSGHVYVSRGLLAILNHEDELAGVLGHEVGHVVKQHSLKRVTGSIAFAPIRLATRIGGGLVGLALPRVGKAVTATVELPAALTGASYGRSQENEADEVGQALAAGAGWDPSALALAMDALARQQTLHGQDPNALSWLATHPASPDRAARIRSRAEAVARGEASSIAATRSEFVARLDGLVVGAAARDGVFSGSRFLHPGLRFVVDFPAGEEWVQVNQSAAVAVVRREPPSAIIVEVVAQGDDALEVARAFEPENGELDAPPRAETVNGLSTAYATGRDRGGWGRPAIRGSARWIAHGGLVYRILSESTESGYAHLEGVFRAAEDSFRPLQQTDYEQISEKRLRLAKAREGETLEALLRRSGSEWDVAEAAAANAVDSGAVFGGGDLVKYARRESAVEKP